MEALILLRLFSTLFMTGLIWFVQIVHYPLFVKVGDSKAYYLSHQFRTSFVVLPVMLAELIASFYLAYQTSFLTDFLGIGLLVLIWLSTFFLQVPSHQKLLDTYSKQTVDFLVKTNWIRTVAWTLRSLLLLLAS